MTEDEIIEQIISSFSEFSLRDIKLIAEKNEPEFPIAAFILCSCFIDQLSGFRYNKEKPIRTRYERFVREYLPAYDPAGLNADLRNKLVHNYSIGSQYGLTRKEPQYHLSQKGGVTLINLESFIKDLEKAFNRFIQHLRENKDIRQNAIKWYRKYHILVLSKMD